MDEPTPDDTPILRLAVVGPFGGQRCSGRRLEVDRGSLDDALRTLEPGVETGPIPVEGFGEIEGLVAPRAFAELQPVAIGQRMPVIGRILALRELLVRHDAGELDAEGVRSAADPALPDGLVDALLAASPSGPPASPAEPRGAGRPAGHTEPAADSDASVDSILSMVEAPAPESREAAARRAVSALTPQRRRRKRSGGGADGGTATRLDRFLAPLLDAVLRHPEVAGLEACWRGLRLLLEAADPRKGVRVDLVDVDRDGAADAIRGLADGEEVDLVLVLPELDASARDLEYFQALAEAGAAIQAPVAVGLMPAFFGYERWSEVGKGRSPMALFDEQPGFAAWKSFRGDERARWIVPIVNRIALRGPYGPDGERARSLAFVQDADAGLLGPAVWAIGVVVARAFAATGACVRISGPRHGLVADLPLLDGGERALPVEGAINEERREDLERSGFAVLAPYQRDIAFVGALRTFRKPERYPDAEATADAAQQVTLAYQLFASRFVRFLGRAVPALAGSGSTGEATRELRDAVCRFVSTDAHPLPGDHVGIDMAPNDDDARYTDVSLRIQPQLSIAGRPVNVMLQFSVPL